MLAFFANRWEKKAWSPSLVMLHLLSVWQTWAAHISALVVLQRLVNMSSKYFIFCLFVFVVFYKASFKVHIFVKQNFLNLCFNQFLSWYIKKWIPLRAAHTSVTLISFSFFSLSSPTTHVKQCNLAKTKCIFPWFYIFFRIQRYCIFHEI